MELPAARISADFKQKIHPVYLVHSDEHLLLQETCDLIIHLAQQAGFTEKERLLVDGDFHWQTLLDSGNSMSLFGEKKIIDLRLAKPTPGKDGSEILCKYLENPSPDNLLLIRAPKIPKEGLNSKWYKAILQSGAVTILWPVKTNELPRWIQQRLKEKNLHIDTEAAQILADRVEGNLLAANQELEKLALLLPANSQISSKQIISAVANSARYDIFTLVDQTLAGNSNKALRMFRALIEEGMEPTLCLWAFRKDVSLLYQIHESLPKKNISQAMNDLRVWQSRQNLIATALQKHSKQSIASLLLLCAEMDLAIKGQQSQSSSGLPWNLLCEDLIASLSGLKTPA